MLRTQSLERKTMKLSELWTPAELSVAQYESVKIPSQITIDRDHLDKVFDQTVSVTAEWSVEKLLEFGSYLCTIIYRYRNDTDRTTLPAELEKALLQT